MSIGRTAIVVVIALILVASPLSACAESSEAPPMVAPSDVHLAGSGSGGASGEETCSPGGRRLDAVRTVALYCRLIGAGQFARAGHLCSRRRLWSRRELASLRGVRFRSARVYAAPDARTLTLQTTVHIDAGPGCTLPDGLATLFFTLGRVGTAVGGWLITAITTSP